jgi:glycosylphosphatidylinositol transamidase (GPIT) subunit GPI8
LFGPSIHNDSEFLKKLISEKIYIKDGGNLWMTTFKSNSPLEFCILLPKKTRISMIRIWNYNKSRIHSTRGVRHISIEMDKKIIFLGEVQKFSGDNCNYLEEAEYILFTENKSIINNIDLNDWLNSALEETGAERGQSVDRGSVRPGTGHLDSGLSLKKDGSRGDDLSQASRAS